jgi:23S rRNA pseudouridine2605 synthase
MPEHEGVRLQKHLAELGLASRREAEAWIRAGRLTVNGSAAILGQRVTPVDEVRLDGRPIRQRPSARAHRTVLLVNRSPGDALRRADEALTPDRESMVERLATRDGRRYVAVSPMPRVDGGLEILTPDGELASALQRAARRLPAEFRVRVRGELDTSHLAAILDGELDRGARLAVTRCEPAGGEGANRWYAFEALGPSGKDVRQLFERQGALVSRVLRTRFGPWSLDRSLVRGRARRLSEAELAMLPGMSPATSATEHRSAAPSRRGSPGRAGTRKAR